MPPFRLPPPLPPLPDSRLLYMSSLDLGGRWRIDDIDILVDDSSSLLLSLLLLLKAGQLLLRLRLLWYQYQATKN